MTEPAWIACESASDLDARLAGLRSPPLEPLEASEYPDTFGYFDIAGRAPGSLPVHYANLGLKPKAIVAGTRLLAGASETVAGYDLHTSRKLFAYRMPTVFHEFVTIDPDRLYLRDEVGFVGIDYAGTQIWSRMLDDVIEETETVGRRIFGRTLEGQRFSFDLPESRRSFWSRLLAQLKRRDPERAVD